jgi:flagellar hook-basal body complex protein FliE
LPRLYIIITANDDTYDECRLLRRGTRFLVDPDKLLQFSRANVADDWRTRARDNPRKGLAFISALFEVRLLNLSSSAVVNACAFGPDKKLREVVLSHYNAKVSTNAANAMRNTPLARALRGEEDVGLAKSNPTLPVQNAFRAIQRMTNAKHTQINQAIVSVIEKLPTPLPKLKFEHYPFSGDSSRGLHCDVWFERDDRPEALEFTHRADKDASVAVIASYVLTKVQDYARDYRLL